MASFNCHAQEARASVGNNKHYSKKAVTKPNLKGHGVSLEPTWALEFKRNGLNFCDIFCN